eukprot:3141300-Amphidinium_carterae.1
MGKNLPSINYSAHEPDPVSAAMTGERIRQCRSLVMRIAYLRLDEYYDWGSMTKRPSLGALQCIRVIGGRAGEPLRRRSTPGAFTMLGGGGQSTWQRT